MSLLLGRILRVTVGDLAVEDLRVGFTIEKSLRHNEPNTCSVSIYNLSRESRERLHKSESDIRVEVAAGYVDTGLTSLFLGTLRHSFSRPERDGSWVTIVQGGDGDGALRQARSTISYRPGVSLERAVSDLAGEMGVGLGNVGKVIKEGNLDGLGGAIRDGFASFGRAGDRMAAMMGSAGLEWSVQNEELQAMASGQPAQRKLTVLSSLTGLESLPEVIGYKLTSTPKSAKAKAKKTRHLKGLVSFRSRIAPDLLPGYLVELQSVTVNGVYRIEKMRAVGDTHGEDWSIEAEARETGEAA
jgi:hypothetical protein